MISVSTSSPPICSSGLAPRSVIFVLASFASHRRAVLLQDAAVDSDVPLQAKLVHTLLWKKLPSRSTKIQASRIAFAPGVFLAVIFRVGHVRRRHDALDSNPRSIALLLLLAPLS